MNASSKSGSSPKLAHGSSHDPGDAPRRNFMTQFLAVVIGGIVGVFPFLAGLTVFFDPLCRRKSNAQGTSAFRRVATRDAVPANGLPVQFPVFADRVDAWNRFPSEPIGAVYLRWDDKQKKIIAFNAICPHAGCFVGTGKREDKPIFQCPCHTSAFELDGARVNPAKSPSPRDLDQLEVDEERLSATGEVWVKFVKYYPATHDRIEMP